MRRYYYSCFTDGKQTQRDSGQNILLALSTQTEISENWFLRMLNVQHHMPGEILLAMYSADGNTDKKGKLTANCEV